MKTALSDSEAGKQLGQGVLKDVTDFRQDNSIAGKMNATGISSVNDNRELTELRNERNNLQAELNMIKTGGGDKAEK